MRPIKNFINPPATIVLFIYNLGCYNVNKWLAGGFSYKKHACSRLDKIMITEWNGMKNVFSFNITRRNGLHSLMGYGLLKHFFLQMLTLPNILFFLGVSFHEDL